MLAVIAVIVAPIGYFVIREGVRDPIFAELDGWAVPGWAAGKHVDEAFGSRWCIQECRYRERTWESSRGPDETNRAYTAAARAQDWAPSGIQGCAATGVDGFQTCLQRDEYVLNLWVRPPVCDVKPTRPQVGPSAAPTAPGAAACPASVVTVKVFNRVAYPDRAAALG